MKMGEFVPKSRAYGPSGPLDPPSDSYGFTILNTVPEFFAKTLDYNKSPDRKGNPQGICDISSSAVQIDKPSR